MKFDIKRALATMERSLMQWPMETVVWHRASGQRGLIDGHVLCPDGSVLLSVTHGNASARCYDFELSRTRVPEDDGGEDWKGGGAEGGTETDNKS